jgi:hypothetical protein
MLHSGQSAVSLAVFTGVRAKYVGTLDGAAQSYPLDGVDADARFSAAGGEPTHFSTLIFLISYDA